VYSIAALQTNGFATDADGSWHGASMDLSTDLANATVSADDHWIAGDTTDYAAVTLLDLTTGTARRFDGLRGPVLFTPSSSMAIAWRSANFTDDAATDAGSSSLALIDVNTGSTTYIDTGFESAPTYFIASDGHRIVLLPYSESFGSVRLADGGVTQTGLHLAVADLSMLAMTSTQLISRSAPSLGIFVDRRGHNELWFLHPNTSSFDRLDLVTGTYETLDLGFTAQAVGYLPIRDTFVFSQATPVAVVYWSPSSRTTIRTVTY
jgi:hypothetical protein